MPRGATRSNPAALGRAAFIAGRLGWFTAWSIGSRSQLVFVVCTTLHTFTLLDFYDLTRDTNKVRGQVWG